MTTCARLYDDLSNQVDDLDSGVFLVVLSDLVTKEFDANAPCKHVRACVHDCVHAYVHDRQGVLTGVSVRK